MSTHRGPQTPDAALWIRRWDDLRLALSTAKRGGSHDPTYVLFKDNGAGSVGVWASSFARSNEVFLETQLPHDWLEGSDVDAHIHWSTPDANAGNVVWGVEYVIADVGGTFGASTIALTGAIANPGAYVHKLTDITTISMAGKKISAVLLCRVFRGAAGDGDTYGSDAVGISFDLHYQRDSLGSRTELAK